MCTRYAFCIILLFFWLNTSMSFNYTSCEHAKQPKFMSSCCDVQRSDGTIKSCRKSLLANSTANGGTNLKSDKVALHACIAECSFRANGFLLSNGTVNAVAMQKSYQQRYKNDPAMSRLLEKSLLGCVDYAQQRAQQSQWMHSKGECDYYPATLLACILEEVYINCPSNKWKNTADCAAMRKYLIACDDVKSSKK
ncbi:hypothetical protein KR018_004336 [Drosophila ironensis]|nr:hypothetical protein KR018_004336 [Drosophila ironensis]